MQEHGKLPFTWLGKNKLHIMKNTNIPGNSFQDFRGGRKGSYAARPLLNLRLSFFILFFLLLCIK